ncbi:hypothetical protein [Saccharospirillum alexandrii]|uniref:hypothetical protein n=1 Tax=Saccharospirillum alexandrii TaxID=2448477 RepID=UPI003736539A
MESIKHCAPVAVCILGLLIAGCNDTGSSEIAEVSGDEFSELSNRFDELQSANNLLADQLKDLAAQLTDSNQGLMELAEQLAMVEGILSCVDEDQAVQSFVIENCNLIVRNGSGSTASSTGLGNLIIGYNADDFLSKDRTGSHNLIIGDEHQYSAYGGLVAGFQNSISSPYATVTGGRDNAAVHEYASISGGRGLSTSLNEAWVAGHLDSNGSTLSLDAETVSLSATDLLNLTSMNTIEVEAGSDMSMVSQSNMSVRGMSSLSLNSYGLATLEGSSGVSLNSSAMLEILGSLVTINGGGAPAARMGDSVVAAGGSGTIVTGEPTVLIGGW